MDEKELETLNSQEVANEAKEEPAQTVNPYRNSPDSKWYVLHTFSGYEQVAKDNLETVVEKFNLQNRTN